MRFLIVPVLVGAVLAVACGADVVIHPTMPSDVAPTATNRPIVQPTSGPTSTPKPQPTSTPGAVPIHAIDADQLTRCISALTIVSLWHHHTSPTEVFSDGSLADLRGSDRATGTPFLREPSAFGSGSVDVWNYLQPFCGSLIDLSVLDQFENGLN